MDAIITAVVGAAPQLGVAGVLLVVLTLVLRREGQDRTDYREQLKAVNDRHTAEIARINASHDAELIELKNDIRDLRRQLDEVNEALDIERSRRRTAEDSALQQIDSLRRGDDTWRPPPTERRS